MGKMGPELAGGGSVMSLRSRFVVAVVVPFVAALGLTACEPPDSYVALGDSYTAGPGITPPDLSIPGCIRSDANYPNLIAPDLGLPAFRDVSCSGAETEDMFATQNVDPNPDNPPQLDALDGNTQVVTLGIGGNDIGFTSIAETCVRLAVESAFRGSPCKDHFTAGGTDQLAGRIAALEADLARVLDAIESRSPEADVFVRSYPAILPETTALFELCQPTMPIAKGDVAYLRDEVQKRLNATVQRAALANGDHFVDMYAPSIGHDACKAPTVRWVEPLAPASDAAPIHPNRLGMQGMADAMRAALRAAGVLD
jgi:GDSL-like Lipase/Acylhydrolase family